MMRGGGSRRCAAGLLVAASLAVAAGDDGAVGMEVVTPRPVGYVVGDTITHVVRLELAGPYRLDESALPRAGRLDRWLELREPVRTRRGAHTEIVFTYQILGTPPAASELVVPRQTLYIAGDDRRLPLFVPEWRFTTATIVPGAQRGAAARFHLQPERLPPPLPLAPDLGRLGALLAALCAVLARLAWMRWGAPWRARRARPFAKALRRLERMRGEVWDEARLREAVRVVHGALDGAAGVTVLPSNLEELFRARPPLAALREPLAALLADSRQLFFGTGSAAAPPTLASLLELCRACRDIERAAA